MKRVVLATARQQDTVYTQHGAADIMRRRSIMRLSMCAGLLATPAILPAQQRGGIRLEYRDTTCSACQALYEYASGNRIRAARRGTDDEAAGTIQDLDVRRRAPKRSILDSLLLHSRETRAPAGPLRAFYGSCLDVRHIEATGTTPLQDGIRRIEPISSVIELSREAASLQRMRVGAIFLVQPLPAPRDAKHVIADLRPFGLGLGDRESYLQNDSATATLRRRYRRQLELTFALAGETQRVAQERAERVLRLETGMAEWSLPMMNRMSPLAIHAMSLHAFGSLAPSWPWNTYFRELHAG